MKPWRIRLLGVRETIRYLRMEAINFDPSGRPKSNVQASIYTSSLSAEAADRIRKKFPSEILEQLSDDGMYIWCIPNVTNVMKGAGDRQKESRKAILDRSSCPSQAALPWAIICLCLTVILNKYEFYDVIDQGLKMVSSIVSHLIVVERVFRGVESVNSRAVTKSLLALYPAVLHFLRETRGFCPLPGKINDKKGSVWEKVASGVNRVRRTFKTLNYSLPKLGEECSEADSPWKGRYGERR